ncbi:hypothetical protein [Paenibacillus jiagnxiensis]|uniref:hypothetical protein n=1 Tax=Paenibacillus jiagnxiensis TaxID=3228926 RepID=UPI0033BAA488
MWKKTCWFFCVALAVIISACSSYAAPSSSSVSSNNDQEEIIISKFPDDQSLHDFTPQTGGEVVLTTKAPKQVSMILNAIKKAEIVSGTHNIADPTHIISIQKNGKEINRYFLWVFEDIPQGSIMHTADTTTIYAFSVEQTDLIKKVISQKD